MYNAALSLLNCHRHALEEVHKRTAYVFGFMIRANVKEDLGVSSVTLA